MTVQSVKALMDSCKFTKCVPLFIEAAVRREQKSARSWCFVLLHHALLNFPPNTFSNSSFHKACARGMEDPAQQVRMEARKVYDAMPSQGKAGVRSMVSNARLRSILESKSGGAKSSADGMKMRRTVEGISKMSTMAKKKKSASSASSRSQPHSAAPTTTTATTATVAAASPPIPPPRRESKRISASSVFSTLTPEKPSPQNSRKPHPAYAKAAPAPTPSIETSVQTLATIQIQSVLRGVHTRKSLGGTKLKALVEKGTVMKDMRDRRKSCVGVLPLPVTPERKEEKSKFSPFPVVEEKVRERRD